MSLQRGKNIVILGAGFAGVRVAQILAKHTLPDDYFVILIDERDTHIYTPDLYEIATAFSQKITEQCLTKLKDTVAIPLSKIFASTKITLMRDKVMGIDRKSKKILLQRNGELPFDYLALCLGSVVNYYDIPGLRQFSYPLKTLTDVLAIDCHLDVYFQTLWKKEIKKEVHIVIGGGGATGVECACELPGYITKLCAKYEYPRQHVMLTIIEASPFLCAAGKEGTQIIEARCKQLGIQIMRETFIKSVEASSIAIEKKGGVLQKLPMDILIWAGGVKAHNLIKESFDEVAKNGAVIADEFLRAKEHNEIFVAGDNAYVIDQQTGKPIPGLAQFAMQQGRMVGENIAASIYQKPLKKFHPVFKGVIVPLGGKYALFMRGQFLMKGFLAWCLRRLLDLCYCISILSLPEALKKWLRDTQVFVEND